MLHIIFRHASALTAVALIGAFGSGMGAQAEVAPAHRAAVTSKADWIALETPTGAL